MNNKKQRNRLFTMLMLVMAILMPYGGHGHRRRLPKVMVKKTVLTSSPKLRSWRGSAIR